MVQLGDLNGLCFRDSVLVLSISDGSGYSCILLVLHPNLWEKRSLKAPLGFSERGSGRSWEVKTVLLATSWQHVELTRFFKMQRSVFLELDLWTFCLVSIISERV